MCFYDFLSFFFGKKKTKDNYDQQQQHLEIITGIYNNIGNFRTLTSGEIQIIKSLKHSELIDFILLYNRCIDLVQRTHMELSNRVEEKMRSLKWSMKEKPTRPYKNREDRQSAIFPIFRSSTKENEKKHNNSIIENKSSLNQPTNGEQEKTYYTLRHHFDNMVSPRGSKHINVPPLHFKIKKSDSNPELQFDRNHHSSLGMPEKLSSSVADQLCGFGLSPRNIIYSPHPSIEEDNIENRSSISVSNITDDFPSEKKIDVKHSGKRTSPHFPLFTIDTMNEEEKYENILIDKIITGKAEMERNRLQKGLNSPKNK